MQRDWPLGSHLHHAAARVCAPRHLRRRWARDPLCRIPPSVSPRACAETTLEQFARGRAVRAAAGTAARFAGAEAVTRARSRLGEDRYRVWTNNCEHFEHWCLSGIQPQHAGRELGAAGSRGASSVGNAATARCAAPRPETGGRARGCGRPVALICLCDNALPTRRDGDVDDLHHAVVGHARGPDHAQGADDAAVDLVGRRHHRQLFERHHAALAADVDAHALGRGWTPRAGASGRSSARTRRTACAGGPCPDRSPARRAGCARPTPPPARPR